MAQPKKHLDSHLVPLERALHARADDLENLALSARGASLAIGSDVMAKDSMSHQMAQALAEELRLIATELHYW